MNDFLLMVKDLMPYGGVILGSLILMRFAIDIPPIRRRFDAWLERREEKIFRNYDEYRNRR